MSKRCEVDVIIVQSSFTLQIKLSRQQLVLYIVGVFTYYMLDTLITTEYKKRSKVQSLNITPFLTAILQ